MPGAMMVLRASTSRPVLQRTIAPGRLNGRRHDPDVYE
jgi:hypothetical protein